MELFSQSQLEAIACAFGDTVDGLTNQEIDRLFASCILNDPGSGTKWKRIYNAFADAQNTKKNRTNILEFIRQALMPVRHVKDPERFERLRTNANQALVLCGLIVQEDGKLVAAQTATTISDARRRALELRGNLTARGIHPDVLKFCREELVADNYFHAVLEAVKSIAEKLRNKANLTGDGATLVDAALSGSSPRLAINKLRTDSERSEQSGFANLIKGTFGMFRNPTAHEARILWQMKKEDAEDLLSLVSLVHRRLDGASVNTP
ncbi:MAG: TIGR02391 family protein [Hyphomonas sp.]|nr:TIGR02391 family protein [Hyphomonas sp.]